jgi:hypothetical protein
MEKLYSPLIIFGKPRKGNDNNNPLLKLYYKTIKDFFLQSLDNLGIGPTSKLRKYFVSYKQANEAIAMDCLTYLQYKRYEKPTYKMSTILTKLIKKEHVFLPYTAIF